MMIIKNLILILLLNPFWVNAQKMKRVTSLPGEHIAYSLTSKEEASIKANLTSYKELRRDTVEDLIYKIDEPSIFVLYKSHDNKFIFDYGQVKYLILEKEETYDYFLNKERYYQEIHSMDFIDLERYNEFVNSIAGLVDAFCKRKSLEKSKLTLKHLNEDIKLNGNQSVLFLKEYIAVLCTLKMKEGFRIENIQLFGDNSMCTLSMINSDQTRITPSQMVAKMYERNTF